MLKLEVLVAAVASLGLAALALGEYVAWWLVAVPALAAAVLLWLFISAVTFVWPAPATRSILTQVEAANYGGAKRHFQQHMHRFRPFPVS